MIRREKNRLAQAAFAEFDRQLAEKEPYRPLFVGECPSASGQGWPALTGESGDRLARLAGLRTGPFRPAFALMHVAERVNLFDYPVGQWSAAAARIAAEEIEARLRVDGSRRNGRMVILCGARVTAAFGLAFVPWEAGYSRIGGPYLVIPHPSSRSRLWGSEEVRLRTAIFLTELFRGSAWSTGSAAAGA